MTEGMRLIRAERGMMAKIARELGITRAAVGKWDCVPGDELVEIERITGIPRHKLRPDLFGPYVRRSSKATVGGSPPV